MFEMDAKGFDKNVSGITHRDENTNIKLNNKIDGGATKHFKLQRHEYIQSIVDQVMHSNT